MCDELTIASSSSIRTGTSTLGLTAASSTRPASVKPSTASNDSPLYSNTMRTLRAKGLNALS
jgi:hypothetical protein